MPSGPACVRLFPEMKKLPRSNSPFDNVNVACARDFSTRNSETVATTWGADMCAGVVQSNCHASVIALRGGARFFPAKARKGEWQGARDVQTSHTPYSYVTRSLGSL
jgi:hypothetical protein